MFYYTDKLFSFVRVWSSNIMNLLKLESLKQGGVFIHLKGNRPCVSKMMFDINKQADVQERYSNLMCNLPDFQYHTKAFNILITVNYLQQEGYSFKTNKQTNHSHGLTLARVL